MNMKDIAILLIFLLAVVGLIIGAYYTDLSDSNANAGNSEKVTFNDSSNVISITLEPKLRNESSMT